MCSDIEPETSHQAEHHRLRHGLRDGLEPPIANVDRIDERNSLHLGLQRLDFRDQRGAARLVVAICKLRLELLDRLRPRPPQRHAARQRARNRAAYRDVGRRAGGRVAGALQPFAFGLRQLPLGEIRKLQVVEEQVDEFLAGQHEAERVLTVALSRLLRLAATALVRARQNVTFDKLLVAGQHHVAGAALATKARLIHAVEGDGNLAAFQHILDVAILRRLLDRALDQRLGPSQEALAVLQALAARIKAPIDDVHYHFWIRL